MPIPFQSKDGPRERIRMTVAYDGTAYAGWQVQPDQPTVQQSLEEALLRLTGARTRVCGSGRTDRGVHARGQVAHVDLPPLPCGPRRLHRSLNGVLRPDIRVMALARTHPQFDARRSATAKEYRYFIYNQRILPPWHRHRWTHVPSPLDVKAMRAAARPLVGRHDFAAFSANPKREMDGTVRSLYRLSIRQAGPELQIIAVGEGFLYKMVRSLAGFLIRVGRGELSPADTLPILESGTRTATVPTAAPHGLYLWRVRYGASLPDPKTTSP